ncbi:hypothetical protein NYR97_09465 [Xanthomonas hydrangeae]|uniref:Integrase catalytic domain-containing protein n=1 Tax=Xanthomonas hydrangeae TaxID=2775159 RepID=A0AAU0BF85_9XANT|nr:hypothetical protein [Xanthomonas hydrangeae]WOB51552.1 hypothetical protein NYR97_09465 [Xanthomonas hydrangeae]
MSEAQASHLLQMITDSPGRLPGGAALQNVVPLMASQKNGRPIWMESHTVERLYAYELEFDPSVLAYYSQVPCRGIERILPNGKRHIGNATADFLVIRRDSVSVVECKAAEQAASLVQQKPLEWNMTVEGVVERPALNRWAADHGMDYRVWIQPRMFGCLLANYELLYSVESPSAYSAAQERILKSLAYGPKTIEQLLLTIPRLSPREIHQLLRSGDVFGPIAIRTLDQVDAFPLFRDRLQCDAAQASWLALSDERLSQASDSLSNSSLVDLEAGRGRLQRLILMRQGKATFTRRFRELDRRVARAVAEGLPELEACLTSYRSSGNRGSRLLIAQSEAVAEAVKRWEAGLSYDKKNAYIEHQIDCEQRGCRPVAKSTLLKRFKAASRAKRALSTGGVRGYQKQRSASDPRSRSLPAIGVGLRLQVDSTLIDNRVFPGIEDVLLLDRPVIYVAIDNATEYPLCYELAFGPARSDALASLLRTFVRTYGLLPGIIQVDRGTENRSKWLAEFCSVYSITLLIHPTAASPFNSAVENCIGRVNSLLHRLPGSTNPDQRGRAVDGRFKSRRTAKLQFATLELIIREVIDEMRSIPGAAGLSPLQRHEALLQATGWAGRQTKIDEDFLFHSSIPIRAARVNSSRGIKTERHTYASTQLLEAARSGDVVEIRRDCENASILRVQMTSGRYKAWAPFAQKIASPPELEVKFISYYLFQSGSSVLERRMASHVALRKRVDACVKASGGGAAHQATEKPNDIPVQSVPSPETLASAGKHSQDLTLSMEVLENHMLGWEGSADESR